MIEIVLFFAVSFFPVDIIIQVCTGCCKINTELFCLHNLYSACTRTSCDLLIVYIFFPSIAMRQQALCSWSWVAWSVFSKPKATLIQFDWLYILLTGKLYFSLHFCSIKSQTMHRIKSHTKQSISYHITCELRYNLQQNLFIICIDNLHDITDLYCRLYIALLKLRFTSILGK